MKKTILTIGSLTLCVAYGVLSWSMVTHSEPPGPEDSRYAPLCGDMTFSDNAAPEMDYQMCCIDYNEALDAVTRDWEKNLKKIVDQERPASDMVDDAYESLRTYQCWMEYVCAAVQYSGYAPIESALGTGLTEEHLGTVPGCQSPENLRMESEYNQFVQEFKDTPLLGVPVSLGGEVSDGVADTFEDVTVENKINFFPRCMSDQLYNNEFANINSARLNYEGCHRALELRFADCSAMDDPSKCTDISNAFVTIEDELKRSHADQRARALESKLGDITTRLSSMEEHVNYMSNYLRQLNSRFKCYISQCD